MFRRVSSSLSSNRRVEAENPFVSCFHEIDEKRRLYSLDRPVGFIEKWRIATPFLLRFLFFFLADGGTRTQVRVHTHLLAQHLCKRFFFLFFLKAFEVIKRERDVVASIGTTPAARCSVSAKRGPRSSSSPCSRIQMKLPVARSNSRREKNAHRNLRSVVNI